jgi:aspartate dehydrogenase
MVKIGIIGCGTIGSFLAKETEKRFKGKAKVAALCDVDKNKAQKLLRSLKKKPEILSLSALIKACDFVVECASAKVSLEVARRCVKARKSVMIMSVGGILGDKNILNAARRMNSRIFIPTGAICGLDAVKAASGAKIDSATLTTRKPPKGLKGAPFIVKNKIDLSKIKKEKVLFIGTASQAVREFPANVNVAAALSLAGIGAKRTKVRIITSPKFKRNSHEIEVTGSFGRLKAVTENVPSPGNPKTSFMAPLSAIATLSGALDCVRIGT